MEIRVSMCKSDGIEIESVVLRSRAGTERLASWLLAAADKLWPKEKKEPPGGK